MKVLFLSLLTTWDFDDYYRGVRMMLLALDRLTACILNEAC